MTVVVAAVGDISTTSISNQDKTSDLVFNAGYDGVLGLGDLQYENGELANFNNYYNSTWGRFKAITYPAPGNHEYNTAGAAGYYSYFGARAGDPTKGYYSFNLGEWHLIALNSNCGDVACDANSAQVTWLKADLLANTKKCVLAYWHHPRFNSGYTHGNATNVGPFWDALYAAKADIVLSGHDHIYERFNPQTPAAVADPTNGIREWVVGTGGRALYGTIIAQPNSAIRNSSTYGVLKLTLKPAGYDWKFMPIAGQTFTDTGSAVCH